MRLIFLFETITIFLGSEFCFHHLITSLYFAPSAVKKYNFAIVCKFRQQMEDTVRSRRSRQHARHKGCVTLCSVIGAVIPGGKVLN
jgi:hypothetical protein